MVNKKNWLNLVLFGIILFFIASRFAGLDQIYHQDEYRWATIANPFFDESLGPHPPLTRYLLRGVGVLLGFDYLRVVPLLFGFLNLILIYLVAVKVTKNKTIGLLTAGLFTFSAYALIANLQIDIDGVILPFFVLLGYWAYLNLLEDINKKLWRGVFFLAIIGGFLAKLSFVLFIGALLVDYFVRVKKDKKTRIKKLTSVAVPIIAVAAAFYYLYVNYLNIAIEYAQGFRFLNFKTRSYFELLFKVFKSLIWLSPLLLLPLIYSIFKKDFLLKYLFWFVYLALNLIFYLILFDFTHLTIERYFMFFIAPSVLISADVLYSLFNKYDLKISSPRLLFSVLTFIAFSFFMLNLEHNVLPLNPKINYIHSIKNLNFDFLIPFSGSSGPVGFYFSAQFILLVWLISVLALISLLFLPKFKYIFLTSFLVFGFGYNLLFINEYLFGSIFGSVPKVARETVNFVIENKSIKEVVTYNDIGAYELKLNNKYLSRFYTAESRDYTQKIKDYRGNYMIVDFPSINKNGRYWPLLKDCSILKEFKDKNIQSYVFDCQNTL